MSKKIIGIKQADGSFFPILKDGEPANKTLELTTVRDGQTAVKVNLYKQYENTDDLEYVDTLLIENLVPHLKQEPSFTLSINLDEDNVLTAEVLDPETGAKSDTAVSLITLSEAQQGASSDVSLSDDNDIFDDEFGVMPSLDTDMAGDLSEENALDDFSMGEDITFSDSLEDDIENNIFDGDNDDSFSDSIDISDDDFSFGEETPLQEDEEVSMDESSSDDDFEFTESSSMVDDLTMESSTEENDPFSMDDFSFDEGALAVSDEETSPANEDEPSFESLDDDSESDFPSFSEEDTFDSINMDGDELSFPSDDIKEDSSATEESFEFPEDIKIHDDMNLNDSAFEMDEDPFSTDSLTMDDDLSSDSLSLDDDLDSLADTQEESISTDSFDLDDSTFASESLDMDDSAFGSESLDMDDSTFASESLDMDDSAFGSESLDMDDSAFGSDSFDLDDNSFTSDSLELGDETSLDSIDFDSDFDLGNDETISSSSNDEIAFSDDFDIGNEPDEDFTFAPANDSVQYADYGAQQAQEDTSTSFIPPLYDTKLKEDIEKKRSRHKYSLPMIVCILCALICIVAVILAFAFGSWPGDNSSVVNNVVTVEPPQVFEQEKLETERLTVPPTPEENTIEVVIEKEVVPVKPEPAPEAKGESIEYLLIWGDTLWDLSDTYYRNPWLYNTIADENNIKDPDYIIAGTYIDIPSR